MSTVIVNGEDVSIQELKQEISDGIDQNSSYKFIYKIMLSLINYIQELENALADEVEFTRYTTGSETEATVELCEKHNLTL